MFMLCMQCDVEPGENFSLSLIIDKLTNMKKSMHHKPTITFGECQPMHLLKSTCACSFVWKKQFI